MTFNIFSSSFRTRTGKHCFFFFVLTCASVYVHAQNVNDLPSLNSIRTPNSPAFSILGVQPTSVERPNTPADIAVALDNATEGFKKFPQNFSLEFAPYWMTKKPQSVTWQADTVRTVEQSLFRTFSVSAATITKEQNDKELRGLSYGFRTLLLSGKTSSSSIKRIREIEKELDTLARHYSELALAEEAALRNELRKRLKEDSTQEAKNNTLKWFNGERTRINNEKTKRINEEAANAEGEKEEFAPQREGFIVELAFAGAYRNDTIHTSSLRKGGYAFWLTPSYVKDDYSLVGVYRNLKDSLSNRSTEFGFRFIYTQSRYALSIEYLKGHYQSETSLPDRERFSVLFEYMLDKNLWLNISLGDDNKNIQSDNSIFSSIGLKYNFSRKRYAF
jgi:hypothetical protein